MPSSNASAIIRLCALTLVAVGIWFAARAYSGLPLPLGLDAPAGSFSAARADAILERILGPEIPHPTGSSENANVRARIESEFARLDVKTRIYSGFACDTSEQRRDISCATVNDIVAEVVPGEGKALILMAHYDSVPAGPGAADDASGVAAIIETVRALKARGVVSNHPVLAVITDGEEAGLLGATLFLDNPELKARVGVVVNVEARGNTGPSLLFQTSPGDQKLIDLYARNLSAYAASSLFPEIYRRLPNDTDLTLFIREGFTGFNFAYIGGISHYHTSLDRRENINMSTLQHQGENILGVATALERTTFVDLQGKDDIYLTVFGRWLPRMPMSWALPLALSTLGIVLAAAFLWRGAPVSVARQVVAVAIPPLMIAACALLGFVIHTLASSVAHQPDPSYAHPAALRIALTFGVVLAAVFCARWSEGRTLALAVWFWMSILAIATAALTPGLAPYFLFPTLIGAVALLIQSRLGDSAGEVLLFIAALPALVIWITLAALGEDLMGLVIHPLFTIPAAFAAMALLPLLAAKSMPRTTWAVTCVSIGALAIAVAAFAGMQPAYSATAPQRLNISLIDDHISNRAIWAVDTNGPLPPALRAAAPFSESEEPVGFTSAYVAPAGAVRYAVPDALFVGSMAEAAWHVSLTLQDSWQADEVFVIVPGDAGLQSVGIGGKKIATAVGTASKKPTVIHCLGGGCDLQSIELTFATKKAIDLTIVEQRYGLPPDAGKLVSARSNLAVPSQTGDSTVIVRKVSLR